MAYDRERYDRDPYDRDARDRDRGTFERAGDEVRSWFGDEEARRRREQDERHNVRGYSPERPYGERDYRPSEREERWRPEWGEERYRDYSDRYGRRYSAARERTFGSGSQEFGPEGYGAAGTYGWSRGREWRSPERWRVPGPHAGRGPKGYQRSDERIREEINDRLTAHGEIDATDIEVRVQGAEVTLIGFVDSREVKRIAEDVTEDVPGVREVHNQLRIRSHAEDTGTGRTSVLGLTERETQTAATARTLDERERQRQSDAAARSRARTP
jgi:osmotically-inducible protein OsmY